MPIHLTQLPALAKQKEDENWRFRQFLKTKCDLDPEEIDARVTQLAKEIWSQTDCTKCANCCKTVSPTLSEAEVDQISRRIGIERRDFIDRYLAKSEAGSDNPWIMKTQPCPFLQDDKCSIYENRPGDCRGYPYVHEPDFQFRLTEMVGRTFTCPIVYELFEELKDDVGFNRRRR